MKRRDFLKAALAGTLGAFVGALPIALVDVQRVYPIVFGKPKRSRWIASATTIKFTSSDGKTFTMDAGPGSFELHLDEPTYTDPIEDGDGLFVVSDASWPVRS